jgi:hypothetical protein
MVVRLSGARLRFVLANPIAKDMLLVTLTCATDFDSAASVDIYGSN